MGTLTSKDKVETNEARSKWWIDSRNVEFKTTYNPCPSIVDLSLDVSGFANVKKVDLGEAMGKDDEYYAKLCDTYDSMMHKPVDSGETAGLDEKMYSYPNSNTRSRIIMNTAQVSTIGWDDAHDDQFETLCEHEYLSDFCNFLDEGDEDSFYPNWNSTLGSAFDNYNTLFAIYIEFREWQYYNDDPVRHSGREFLDDARNAPAPIIPWCEWLLMKVEYLVQCNIEIAKDDFDRHLDKIRYDINCKAVSMRKEAFSDELPF